MNKKLYAGLVGAVGLASALAGGCAFAGRAIQVAGAVNGGVAGKAMQAAGAAIVAAEKARERQERERAMQNQDLPVTSPQLRIAPSPIGFAPFDMTYSVVVPSDFGNDYNTTVTFTDSSGREKVFHGSSGIFEVLPGKYTLEATINHDGREFDAGSVGVIGLKPLNQ